MKQRGRSRGSIDTAPVKKEAPPVEKPAPKRKPRKASAKQIIAAKYSVDVKQIVKWRIEDGLVVVLINYGIKGTKKYKVPLADFPQPLE